MQTHSMSCSPLSLLVGRAVVVSFAAALALGACSEPLDSTGPGGGGVSSMMNPGELVYIRSCSRCHAVDRGGKTDAPSLDSVRIATLGRSRLEMTIRYGKGRMEGFGGLTDQEVVDLIAYLESP